MQPIEGCRPVAINVGVKDLEQAIEFYEATLGVTFDTDESGGRARAVAAGAGEHCAPMDAQGLPRHSRVADPSGNRLVLWQK